MSIIDSIEIEFQRKDREFFIGIFLHSLLTYIVVTYFLVIIFVYLKASILQLIPVTLLQNNIFESVDAEYSSCSSLRQQKYFA